MPSKKTPTGTAQEWLKRAKGNLALAKQPKPKEAFWDDLCFDAQQAAEKSNEVIRGGLEAGKGDRLVFGASRVVLCTFPIA